MKEKHFIISLSENIVVLGTEGSINRNSNSSQWIDVALKDWKLNEGEVLYIELEHYDNSTELTTRVGPLQLFYNTALDRYVTLAPPEFISISGEWKYSIELRFNISDDTSGKTTTTVTTVTDSNGEVISTTVTGKTHDGEIVYNSIPSAGYTLYVTDTIVKPTMGNIIKETELISASQIIADNSSVAIMAANEAKLQASRAEDNANLAKLQVSRAEDNANLAANAAEEAKEAARISSSKAVVIWGFNQAVDVTELDWEVK